MPKDPVLVARSKVGNASRTGQDVEAARRDLRAAMLERHVRQVVAAAPPLSPEARERIAMLLMQGGTR